MNMDMNFTKLKEIRKQIPVGLAEAQRLLKQHATVEQAVVYWHKQNALKEQQVFEGQYDDIEEIWFFEPTYCHNIDPKDLQMIHPLTPQYASKLWGTLVSPKHRHLMTIEGNNWYIKNERKVDYNWEVDWEEDRFDAFTEHIAPLLKWDTDHDVLFFWGRYTALEAPWKLLCKYWISLLYEDEMNIVINPKSNRVLILGTRGYVAIGERVGIHGYVTAQSKDK